MSREFGKVVNKIAERGYLFIRPETVFPTLRGKNLFLHFSNLETDWLLVRECDRVSFEVEQRAKGIEAIKAKVENV